MNPCCDNDCSGRLVLFRKVVIPVALGDETKVPPVIGKYINTLLEYQTNGHVYLYSSDGIPTMISTDVAEIEARIAELSNEIEDEKTARQEADTNLYTTILEVQGEIPVSFTNNEWSNFWT